MADYVTQVANYAALTAWWSTVPDPVPAGDNYIAELADGTYILSSFNFTKGVTAGGKIIVRPQTGAGHRNAADKTTAPVRVGGFGKNIVLAPAAYKLTINNRYRFEGIQFDVQNGLDMGAANEFEGVIVRGGPRSTDLNNVFTNCLLYTQDDTWFGLKDDAGGMKLYGCAVINFGSAPAYIGHAGGSGVVEGCYFASAGTTAVTPGGGTFNYNAVSQATAVGTNCQANMPAATHLVDVSAIGSFNGRIKAGSALLSRVPASVLTEVNGIDLIGAARSDPYDVGPVTGSTVTTTKTLSVSLKLVSGAAAANQTGLSWAWWNTMPAAGALTAPDQQGTGKTTDAAGLFSISPFTTPLGAGSGQGALMIYKGDQSFSTGIIKGDITVA